MDYCQNLGGQVHTSILTLLGLPENWGNGAMASLALPQWRTPWFKLEVDRGRAEEIGQLAGPGRKIRVKRAQFFFHH